MGRKTIETVDIEFKKEDQIDAVLQHIADTYGDPYRVIYEYIANSVDSAHELRMSHNKKDFPYPIKIIIDVNISKKTVFIADNCTGIDMDIFRGLAQKIFIRKKSLPWAIGKFGFGVHSFRSFFKRITFVTKTDKNRKSYELSFERKKVKENPITELDSEDDPLKNQTGTIVWLKDLDPKRVKIKSFSHLKLRDQIELHFENILRESDLKIEVRKKGYKFPCKPFDYDSVEGEYFKKDISVKIGDKKSVINVFLRITEKPFKERMPRFTCRNIRINEIASCPSFRRGEESTDITLWEHPNLIGFIEVNDLLDPELERSDFPAGIERDTLYQKIREIEAEIKKIINKITEKRNVESLSRFGSLLENIFSKISREDTILLRERLRKAGKDEIPDLFVSGEGGAEEIGEGGPSEGPGGMGGTCGLGEGFGEGLGGEGEGKEIGEDIGGIGTTEAKPKTGTPAKKRRSSGLSIIFRALGEETEPAQKVPGEFGYTIVINTNHKNWEERIRSKTGKIDLSDGRIPAYCAQLITTFYIQIKNDKFKNLPENICDEVFFEFTEIVCRAEALLYKHRAALKKMIISQTT